MGLDAFVSKLTALWRCQLRQLGHSQNSIELLESLKKKWHKSPKIATDWFWSRWDERSKILLAMWMESVIIMILEMLSLDVAWLMLYLIVNNLASELMTNAAWWRVLMRGWFEICVCKMDIAISFLILASNVTMAMDCDEEASTTTKLSWWMRNLLLFFLYYINWKKIYQKNCQ